MTPKFDVFSVMRLLSCMFVITWWGSTIAWSAEPAGAAAPQPIRFWADQSVFDTKAKRAVLDGRVKVTQIDNTILADHMTIIFQEAGPAQGDIDPDSIETIEARGNVRIEFDSRIVTGDQAEYHALERKLIISGPGTRFIDGQDEISAGKITYYRDDGRVEFTSNGEQQVRGIVHTSERGLN